VAFAAGLTVAFAGLTVAFAGLTVAFAAGSGATKQLPRCPT
jgi:hypothetical protein